MYIGGRFPSSNYKNSGFHGRRIATDLILSFFLLMFLATVVSVIAFRQ